jgi:hypothetical protein
MKKIPDLTSQLVSAMREDSNKWNFIVRILKQEKDAIDWNVHEKKDDQGKELTAKQIYELITWWQFLDYVINLPETILNESKPKPKQKEPDYEVYDLPKPLKGVRDEITEHLKNED